MSYLALARKWRPRRFSDVVGQAHVVQALSHALDKDQLHPAILLTGTRGCGKTTLARIVAKGLNCETGVKAEACGTCSACRELDEGRFVDLIEIDAASNTGIDNVRDLIDNAQYSPVRGRYKVFLIDEVHMLSKAAFNALLKTLEEPPPHVKFILATTDPQKLLATILSRCLQFHLKRLPSSTIRELLGKVLTAEGGESEPAALAQLARAADGSMRDGLSLLDQAIVFAGGRRLEGAQVEAMLGTAGRRHLVRMLDAVQAQDGPVLIETLRALEEFAPDYEALLNDLATDLQRVAMLQLLPGARSDDDEEDLVALSGRLPVEDVQLYYQIAVHARRDLQWTPEPRLGFEMALLRMLAFRPSAGGAGGAGAAGTGAGSSGASAPGRGAPSRAAAPAETPATRATTASATVTPTAPATAAAPATATTPATATAIATSNPTATARSPGRPTAAVNAAATPATQEAAPSGPAATPADIEWASRVDTLGLDGMARQLARNCAWLSRDAGIVRLAMADAARHLLRDDHRLLLETALSKALGEPVKLVIDVVVSVAATPAAIERARLEERKRAAQASIENDPGVQLLQQRFGAAVRPGSVQIHDGGAGAGK